MLLLGEALLNQQFSLGEGSIIHIQERKKLLGGGGTELIRKKPKLQGRYLVVLQVAGGKHRSCHIHNQIVPLRGYLKKSQPTYESSYLTTCAQI